MIKSIIIEDLFIMANKKKEAYRPKTMTEGKKAVIQG